MKARLVDNEEVRKAIEEHYHWACRVAVSHFPQNYAWREDLESAATEALWREACAWVASGKRYNLRRYLSVAVRNAAIDEYRRLTKQQRSYRRRNVCKECDGLGEVDERVCERCNGTGKLQAPKLVSLDELSTGDHSPDIDLRLAGAAQGEEQDWQSGMVWEAIALVADSRSREVLAWTMAGWQLKEIGTVYGLTESRVSQLLTKARNELIEVLSAEDDGCLATKA